MESECVACYTPTQSKLAPCRHAMCDPCALKWLAISPSCPMCRSTITHCCISHQHREEKWIPLEVANTKAGCGITLSNCVGGVRVHALRKQGMAYKGGLRKGHIITCMNNIPVKDHANAILIVNACTEENTPIACFLYTGLLDQEDCVLWRVFCRAPFGILS
jgi:hypothetical protein